MKQNHNMFEGALQSTNTTWHNPSVTRERREALNNHKSVLLWYTGLSGAGKSTLAHTVEEILHEKNCRTIVLDGDNVRHGLCGDLGFSDKDRIENIRRIGEVTKLFLEAGMIVLTAFISPFNKDRQRVKQLVGEKNFIQIYCKCPVEVCEQRDVKGNYKKARLGLIKNYTGVSAPYEEPEADLVIRTNKVSLNESASLVIELLKNRGIINHSC
jgi:adenylylsulfate kinase